MGRPLPPKTPNEVKVVTFEFETEVPDDTTIANPTVEKTLVRGNDTGAATLTITYVQIVGEQIRCLVGGGLDDNKYRLRARCYGSNGEIHEIITTLVVKSLAA